MGNDKKIDLTKGRVWLGMYDPYSGFVINGVKNGKKEKNSRRTTC